MYYRPKEEDEEYLRRRKSIEEQGKDNETNLAGNIFNFVYSNLTTGLFKNMFKKKKEAKLSEEL